MKRYEMTPALRTGNELIDMEHERILEEANALLDACQAGNARNHLTEIADFLEDYVAVHFTDEENLQTEYDYPDYPNHKKFHEWYKKELKKNLTVAKTESNVFQVLGSINRIMEILIKHIGTEDSRLAKWVREKSGSSNELPAEQTSSGELQFKSSFQVVAGTKKTDLHALVDSEQLRNRQELFTEATGMSCAVMDLSGCIVVKGSGSPAFMNLYTKGKHDELLEFKEELILNGHQVGSLIGGISKEEAGVNRHLTQKSVSAAGKLFAETVNYWFNALSENAAGSRDKSVFYEEAGHIEEAIRQIKGRAKGLEQTATMEKMLSLNAAIEAGRAGKAGVGFAVVAEEIGRMANESAAVYREIQDLVHQAEESILKMEQDNA